MAGGKWEKLSTDAIVPGLQQAAAELNQRDEIVAEVSEYPLGEGWLLWIARRQPPLPFLWPQGALTIHDEPSLPMIRVEETDPRVAGGNPVVRVYLTQSSLTACSIKRTALDFAERLICAEPNSP